MKAWLGVIGRACIEFCIVILLLACAEGLYRSLLNPDLVFSQIALLAGAAALRMYPAAGLIALFLSFFSFDSRVKNRAAGWLGLVLTGCLLFGSGLAARRILSPSDWDGPPTQRAGSDLPAPGLARDRGGILLWFRALEGDLVSDPAAVDFDRPSPRLVYAPSAELDRKTGMIRIEGRDYPALAVNEGPSPLLPELALFRGDWIWERLASGDHDSPFLVAAVAAGFVLLAAGLRFLRGMTTWPLANAFLAGAGLLGLLAGDAALASPLVEGAMRTAMGRMGLALPHALLLAGFEAVLGLLLGIAELLGSTRRRGGAV
jgi:hypothetical protein